MTCLLPGLLTGCETTRHTRYNHYMDVKNYEAAKDFLQEEVGQDPYNPEAHLQLGLVHLQLGEYKEAQEAFRGSRQTSSEYIDRIGFLLEKYYRMELKAAIKAMNKDNYEEAVSCLLKAKELKPGRHEIYPALGYSYLQLQKYDEARSGYLQATALNDRDAASFHALAELAFRQDDTAGAFEYARLATHIDGQLYAAQEILAYTGLDQENYELAEQAFLSIPEERRSVSLVRNYALTLFNKGEFNRALPHLESLNKRVENNVQILQTLAMTYYHLNHYTKMVETYEAIRKHNPDSQRPSQEPDML
ncbi:MAG: tetratricopeptide repeat protein [Balneolales bacterium]